MQALPAVRHPSQSLLTLGVVDEKIDRLGLASRLDMLDC